MALFRAFPDRRELQRLDLEAALFERFLGGVLRRGPVHVGPAAGQGPAAAVGGLAHHQDALVVVKDSGADVHLGGRITGLAGEQGLDPFDRRIGAGREYAGGELAYGLVPLTIVRVAAEPVWAIACNSRAHASQSGSFIGMARLDGGATRRSSVAGPIDTRRGVALLYVDPLRTT